MITKDRVYSLDFVKEEVEKYLQDFLEAESVKANNIDASYKIMLEIIKEHLVEGGKRLRPYLVNLTYFGYGGKSMDYILPSACSWELLHAALLVHDDIIDRDDIRHSRLNVFGRYREIYKELSKKDYEHYATSSALLAGDLLLSYSQKIIIDSELESEHKIEVLSLLNQAIFNVGGGELLDAETALYELNKTNARKIANYKTAGYTFELPLITGAYLAGANQEEIDTLRLIGIKLGISFQLIDDILGVFGDINKTGKHNDGDIRERKHTVLIQETYKRVDQKNKSQLDKIYNLNNEISEKDISLVKDIIIESGAKEIVLDEAKKLTNEAEKLINKLSMEIEAKTALLNLIDKLLKRTY